MRRVTLALLLLTLAGALPGPSAFAQGIEGHPAPYLVDDVLPGPKGLGPNQAGGIAPLGDLVIFVSTERLSELSAPVDEWSYALRLLRSDGTAAGTYQLLPEERTLAAWFATDGPVHFLYVCEDAAFTFEGLCAGAGLWRTDGTPEGTYELTGPGTVAYFQAGRFGRFSNELGLFLFRGFDPHAPEIGGELWASDGTQAGTRLVSDLKPEGDSNPRSFVDLHGATYFLADGESSTRWARTDGTAEGTVLLPNPLAGEASPLNLVAGDDELFSFLLAGSTQEVTLWRTDGTAGGATLLAELGPIHSNGFEIVAPAGGRLYFFVDSRPFPGGPVTRELWVSDGTPAGTRVVPRPEGTPGWMGSFLHRVRTIGDHLYFSLQHPEHGDRPWVTDGTAAGTRMIPLLCEGGACPSMDSQAIAFRGEVLVIPRTSEANAEPHFYDPETHTLRKLAEFCPGACGTKGIGPVETVGGVTYMFVNDELHEQQFWVTDGTAAGTRRVTDFPTDVDWFIRQVFPPTTFGGTATAVANGRLFFGADDRVHGWELWALPIPSDGPAVPARPPTAPLTNPELPGYATWVRISAAGASVHGRAEPECIPETLCVSGAIPGRSEVFVRIVGPKPNGFLWPTLVKFTTSTVEVWIEQLATGTIRYYRLDGASPGSSVLPGLFDRNGFVPD